MSAGIQTAAQLRKEQPKVDTGTAKTSAQLRKEQPKADPTAAQLRREQPKVEIGTAKTSAQLRKEQPKADPGTTEGEDGGADVGMTGNEGGSRGGGGKAKWFNGLMGWPPPT
eukprot:4093819-Karenia_brevis.AAC.1